MNRFNFKTVTLFFFILLMIMNLVHWFFFPCEKGVCGFFYHHGWVFYTLLISFYLIVPFVFSFFPCSRFHTRNILCHGNGNEKWISITFDDGPDPLRTPQILDILKKHSVPACFFLIGKKIPGNELLVKRIFQEGHETGNHSYSHSHTWDFQLPRQIHRDLKKTEALVENIVHRKMGLFRPPYGVVNPMVESAVRHAQYTMVAWSIRSFDTLSNDEDKLVGRITKKLKPGDIVLLHDDRQITVNCLEKLIVAIREKGFQTVSLEKLLKIAAYV